MKKINALKSKLSANCLNAKQAMQLKGGTGGTSGGGTGNDTNDKRPAGPIKPKPIPGGDSNTTIFTEMTSTNLGT